MRLIIFQSQLYHLRLQIKSKHKKPKFPSDDKKMREYINVLENRIDELEQ